MNRDMQHAEMQTSRLQTLGQQQQQVTEIAGDYNIRMNKEVAKQKAQGRKYHEKRRETALEKQHEARRQRQEIEDQADRESEAHQNRLSAMENEETIRQETRNRARRERHEKKMAELDAQVEATRENAEKSMSQGAFSGRSATDRNLGGRVVAELRNRRRQRTMQAAIEQEQSSSNTFAQTRTRQKQPKTKTELETDAMLDNFFADGSGVPTAGPSTNQAPAPVMHPQAFQGMQAPGFHPGIQHPGMFVPGQQGQWGQHPQRMLPAPRPAEPLPWENMTQQMGNMNLGRGQRMATPQPVPMRQGRVPAMANTRRPASRPPSNDGIESEDEFDSGEEVD